MTVPYSDDLLERAMARKVAGQTHSQIAEAADSDDAAHLLRDDRAHHCEMMPPI